MTRLCPDCPPPFRPPRSRAQQEVKLSRAAKPGGGRPRALARAAGVRRRRQRASSRRSTRTRQGGEDVADTCVNDEITRKYVYTDVANRLGARPDCSTSMLTSVIQTAVEIEDRDNIMPAVLL